MHDIPHLTCLRGKESEEWCHGELAVNQGAIIEIDGVSGSAKTVL